MAALIPARSFWRGFTGDSSRHLKSHELRFDSCTIFDVKIEARICGEVQNKVKSNEINGAGGGIETSASIETHKLFI